MKNPIKQTLNPSAGLVAGLLSLASSGLATAATVNAAIQGISGFTRNGNTLTFQHPQSAAPASDVTGGYCWSTDLAAFHGDGASAGGTSVTFTPAVNTPISGTTTVTATISGNTPPRLFVVFGASKNP